MARVAILLALVLLVGCEEQKVPGAVTQFGSAATAAKAALGSTVRAAQAQTSMARGAFDRSVGGLVAGQPTSGSLGADDPLSDGGSYFDIWMFDLAQESDVSLTLTSGAFDTYLTLFEGGAGSIGGVLGENDDSNGSTNSTLEGTLPAGTYTAVASSYASGSTGMYELTLRASSRGTSGTRILEPGRPSSGTLSASDPTRPDPQAYFQEWSFAGKAGDQVTLSLSSGDFDTLVGLLMDGMVLADNDDSGGTTNSSLTFYLPWSGTYTAVVTSYAAGETGAYTVSLSTVPRAPFAGFRSGGDPNGRYALLVGIADYPGGDDDLIGPDEDARIMQRLLVERFGFDPANIVLLQNEDATRTNIAQGIAQHLGQAGPNGVAVLYYSGHGAQVGENVGITGSLDFEPSGQDQVLAVYGTDDLSLLLDEELGYLVESLDAGRTLVVLDACFSGSATRGPGFSRYLDLAEPSTAARLHLPRNFISDDVRALRITDMSPGFGNFQGVADVLARPQRHILWAAASDTQESWTSVEYRTGAFTTILDRTLRSEPGSSTFAQLQRLVHDEVAAHTGKNPEMALQDPQLTGERQSMTIDDFFRQR